MQQTSKLQTSGEMGLLSLTTILSEISTQSVIGNNFLDSIEKKFDDVLNYSKSIVSVLNDNLSITSNTVKNKSQEILQTISNNLSAVLDAILNKKPEKINPGSPLKPDKNLPKENKNEVNTSGLDIKGLTDLFKILKESLGQKLFKLMDRFNTALDKMVSLDSKKIGKFNGAIIKFNEILLNLQKNLKPVTLSLIGFAVAFGILSLVVLSPMLPVALLMLTGFLYVLQKTAGNKDMPNNMIQFAAGIGILTLGLIAMSFVDWTSIMKMVVFAGTLSLIFSIGGKRSELPNNMIQFATGLGILTLAMVAMSFVEWSSVFKMLLFAGTLGFIFSLGKGANELPNQMMKFAMGLGILTLALVAMDYIEWSSISKLLLFIGGLGLELFLINKFAGGSGPMKGLPGFAFGIGLLVLAMYAMKDLPWQAMTSTLLFIGGLGLVLKLFSPKSGLTMIMIGAGILAISGAFWIYKQSGFQVSDALSLAGSMGIVSAVVIGLGIPAISALVFTGSLALAAISASMLLSALALAGVSALNIDFGKILEYMGAVAMITAGFALLAIPAIPGALGATLFIPIALSALLGAGTIALLSVLPINKETIFNFMYGVGIMTLGFAAIAIPAIPGALGAGLFIPIALSALMGAGALALISKIEINQKNIDNFAFGIKALVGAYNDLGIIALGKTALKSAALLPIIAVSALAAGLFARIQNIDYIKGSVGLSVMISTLTTSFEKMSNWKSPVTGLSNLNSLASSLKTLNDLGFKSLTDTMNMFINGLSDDSKWNKINKNLETMRDTVKEIVSNINMINLTKSFALERNLKLLTQQLTNENLKIIIKELKELIGLLNESQLITSNQIQQPQSQPNNQPAFTSFNPILPENKSKETQTINTEDIEMILNQILNKLGGNLNVVLIDGNANKFSLMK